MDVILGNSNDVLKKFEPESIDMVFTSPSPYGHGEKEGLGSEIKKLDYIINLGYLFKQVQRVLKPTGSLWVNLSVSHIDGELPPIAEHFVVKMRALGWLLRSKCIWVRTEKFNYQEDYNRFARDIENLYFFTKSRNHYFNNPNNKVQSSVFYADYKIPRKQEFESGFPEKIIERCISLCCPPNGVILDPLAGSGVTGVVAKRMNRRFILIDLDETKVLAMRARLGIK